jgi:hypothetical protein
MAWEDHGISHAACKDAVERKQGEKEGAHALLEQTFAQTRPFYCPITLCIMVDPVMTCDGELSLSFILSLSNKVMASFHTFLPRSPPPLMLQVKHTRGMQLRNGSCLR